MCAYVSVVVVVVAVEVVVVAIRTSTCELLSSHTHDRACFHRLVVAHPHGMDSSVCSTPPSVIRRLLKQFKVVAVSSTPTFAPMPMSIVSSLEGTDLSFLDKVEEGADGDDDGDAGSRSTPELPDELSTIQECCVCVCVLVCVSARIHGEFAPWIDRLSTHRLLLEMLAWTLFSPTNGYLQGAAASKFCFLLW